MKRRSLQEKTVNNNRMLRRLTIAIMLTLTGLTTYGQGVGKEWWDSLRKTLNEKTSDADTDASLFHGSSIPHI